MKKTVLISTLLMAILFSFTAVLADDTQILIDMIRTEVASTVIAEIQQTLESDGIEIIVKNQGTPSPLVSSGYVWGTWKPTQNPLATNAAQLVKGPTNNYRHWAHGVQFSSTWTVRNIGKVDWDTQFYFRYKKGQGALEGDLYMLPYSVAKGETITFTRSFECADEPGIYNSYWQLVDNDGVVILDDLWVGWQVDDWRDYQ